MLKSLSLELLKVKEEVMLEALDSNTTMAMEMVIIMELFNEA
jgi:hypothetical protein